MSADVLVFSESRDGEKGQSHNVLLPVYAVECEARPPIETELDAYEEAVLKFLNIDLPPASIRNAINVTPGMLDTIFSQLAQSGYAKRKKNVGWRITEAGQKYLKNEPTDEQVSKSSEYGYMFVSALRKDILCYFHKGPIDKILVRQSTPKDRALERNGNDQETFSGISVSSRQLSRVYAAWRKLDDRLAVNDRSEQRKEIVEESSIIAEQLFADLESYDEVDETPLPERVDTLLDDYINEDLGEKKDDRKRYIRKLETPPKRFYIQIRLIFDPSKLNGYDTESPFTWLGGIDSPWFLRQIQWMARSEGITLNNTPLREFLEQECVKFGGTAPLKEKDVSVHMLQVIPRLKYHRERFSSLYNIYPELYSLQQRASSLLEKESVVAQFCTKLLEPLFNMVFKTVPENTLHRIRGQIRRDDQAGDANLVCQRIERATGISMTVLGWNVGMVMAAIGRLERTRGNSTLEKAINLLTLYAYAPSPDIRRYVEAEGLSDHLMKVGQLNDIRRSVSHDTNHRFNERDYDQFMQLVYPIADRLLLAIVGG